VESASNGAHGSLAYEIWGDSKWAEFYIHDLYTALGMDREAKGVTTGSPATPTISPAAEPTGSGTGSTRYGGTAGGHRS
jgi:hypothetical protein